MEKILKNVGTFVPLSALSSSKLSKQDQGTFAAGIIFLDWLKKTNQSAWQLLPLHETQLEMGSDSIHVPSPYKGYGIGLSSQHLSSAGKQQIPTAQALQQFCTIHNEWITDYTLFCALRDHFHTDDWKIWDEDIRNRKTGALSYWTEKLKNEINRYLVLQWQLHREYGDFLEQTHSSSISLIGDLPFYVSVNSPLVWAHQEIFQIEKNGQLRFVSGIPKTDKTHFGRQIWGHPLYNWKYKEQIIAFWKIRIRYQAFLYDMIRVDHAKAFFEYGVIDTEDESGDSYLPGPGAGVLEELTRYCKRTGLAVFAEDSGEHIAELRTALRTMNIPGIKIFRFAYNEKREQIIYDYAEIEKYPENTVVYSTTHDTETLIGYLQILTPAQKKILAEVSHVPYDPSDVIFAKNLRTALLLSPAKTIIIPMQDWLLTSERINLPGTEKEKGDKNWNYQVDRLIEELPSELF